jgi:tetratricopeptide (TPR) repeat protein
VNRKKILEELFQLKKENQWQTIIRKFDSLLQPGTEEWHWVDLLKEIGFAHSQLGHFQRALELYLRWLELQPDRPQPPYSIGFIHYVQKDYRTAIQWFNRALEKYPGYLICRYRKGFALLATQKPSLARKEFEFVIEAYENLQDEDQKRRLRKTYIRALFEDGKACFQLRRYLEAVKRFERVLHLDRFHFIEPVFKYYNLGKSFLEMGNGEAARKYLERALRCKPERDFVWERLGRLYHRLLRNPVEAERCFEKALECRRAPYILVSRGLFYLDRKNEAAAIRDLHEALRKDKKGKHKIYLILGKIELQKRRFTQAETYFRKAIDFKKKVYDADYGEAHYFLGHLWRLRGEEQKAQEEFQIASQVEPGLVWNTRVMGEKTIQFVDIDTEEVGE